MEKLEDARHRRASTRAIQSRASPDYSHDDYTKDDQTPQFLVGLTIASLASTLLTTLYELFYVDFFLRIYELPLETFGGGNVLFSLISTTTTVAGAWFVDSYAHQSSRSDIIGISGCLFALAFLAPFFRWQSSRGLVLDGLHFVLTTSLYDSLFSFSSILLGSIVTDDHTMSDQDRIHFMASGKLVNLIASFVVARLGLKVFSDDDTFNFCLYIVMISFLACCLFSVAQSMVQPGVSISWKWSAIRKATTPENQTNTSKRRNHSTKRKLRFKQVVLDFWMHDNFRAWIGMEMLLECQNSFITSFLKTFVDRLIVDAGGSKEACDWLLSLLSPMRQIAAILCYIPIRRIGYRKTYTYVFWANLILSATCLAIASPQRPYLIIAFLFVYSVMTGAVQSAGFHLAMSDMVLEMKRNHAMEGRLDEPSLAGLFMGANALLCKPMTSVLPIVAAFFLDETDFTSNEQSEGAQWVLFYLLVVPPLVFSCLQLLSWRKYNLNTQRMNRMRVELDKLLVASEGHNLQA